MDRVSETQLQVSENSNFKGLKSITTSTDETGHDSKTSPGIKRDTLNTTVPGIVISLRCTSSQQSC